MPETPGTNADGTPKLGSWDATPEMVFDHRFSSMQTNTNKVNATLWGTQGGNYLYTSAKGINPNSSDKNNAVYFLVDPNTGQMVKSGNFYGTGGGIADVFGADDTLRAFSGRPTYGASLYGSSVTRDPNMASKVAVQQTTSGGTIGPNTTYTSSGAINNGSTPAVQAPAPQVQGVTQPSQGYQSPTAPLGSAERTQQLLQAAQQQTGTTGQNAPQQPQQAQNALVMPASGSVVDLLNMAGQDSSFAARKQLAQQYGIQGYTGTAAQNQDLAKKYLEAYNAQKGSAVPQNQAEARNQLQSYFDTQVSGQDPLQQFYGEFGGLDPITASLFDQLAQLNSQTLDRQSYAQLYAEEMAKSGIQPLQEDLAQTIADIRMTEENVREELSGGGGLVLEAQVRGISAVRTKALLTKAEQLSNIIDSKNEAVDRIVQLTQMDRDEVDKQFDRKLGLTTMIADYTMKMQDRARENYRQIVTDIGYDGLVDSISSPQELNMVAKTLGMSPQTLLQLSTVKTTAQRQMELDEMAFQLSVDKFNEDKRQFGLSYALESQKLAAANAATNIVSPYQAERTTRNIDAIKAIESKVGPLTVGLGSYGSYVAGTAARDFEAQVSTLKANIAFSELTAMREASKTGGALGAISDRELGLLQSSLGALDTGQSPKAFRQSLKDIEDNIYRWNAQMLSVGKGYDYDGLKNEGYTDEEIYNRLK